MISFVDSPRFPESISEGAAGGPSFRTAVFESHDGTEQRGVMWRLPRHRYNVALGIRTANEMDTVADFFYTVRGRFVGFRYKDWNDYEIVNGNIGTGDGATTDYQIVKKYTVGTYTFTRNIFKPVSGTLVVKVNNVTQTLTTDYTINYDTGIVSFVVAPTSTHPIVVSCEFDVPVRLDTDLMSAQHVGYEAMDWTSITLVEVLHNASQYASVSTGLFFDDENNSQYIPVLF